MTACACEFCVSYGCLLCLYCIILCEGYQSGWVVGRGLRVEDWVRYFMGTALLVRVIIWNRFWGRYCIDTALLMGLFICNGFWGDIVLAQRCWCDFYICADCHNWREDIVVPFVTTYAVPLRMRLHFSTKYIAKKPTN